MRAVPFFRLFRAVLTLIILLMKMAGIQYVPETEEEAE